MAKEHWNVVVSAKVVRVDEDGVEHPWPSDTLEYPGLDYDTMVEIEQDFKEGFVDRMYAKGAARVKEKKKEKK